MANGFRVGTSQADGEPLPGSSPSSARDLLRRIRSRRRRLDLWPLILIGGFIWAALLAWQEAEARSIAATVFVTLGATFAAAALDRRQGKVEITYEFDPFFRRAHLKACALFEALARKKTAGVGWSGSGPLSLFPVGIGDNPPVWLRTNVPVPSLSLKDEVFYFLPDCLLAVARDGVESVGYGSLHLTRLLHSPSSLSLPREVLQLSWQGAASHALAFANPSDLDSLETALHLLKDGQVADGRTLHFPSGPLPSLEEGSTSQLFPGTV